MERLFPIQFVSLGPGDPELITLKGLRLLQQADFVFCPATGNEQASKAARIVKALGIGNAKIRLYSLPMNRNRENSLAAYNHLCQTVLSLQAEGKQVAIAAEGDAGFYSSTHYIYELLRKNGSPASQVPGIPAFLAAGAKAGIQVACQSGALAVLSGTAQAGRLKTMLGKGYTVVIMKLPACAAEVKLFLSAYPGTECHYFEYVGMKDEFYSTDIGAIGAREFPYFSLMMLKPAPFPSPNSY